MFFNSILLISFILVGIISGNTDHSTYPPVTWHPSNPVFACTEPKINVRIGDLVNLLCPTDDFKLYSSVVYENLYFLGTEYEKYKACNATGMKRLLTCDGQGHMHTLHFREIKTSIGAIAFTKGETYYFIGTGFRVKQNLDLTVNGSCRYTDKQGKYKLRLKIYVCKDEDTDCNTCRSEACYYKDCGSSTCSSWSSDGQIYQKSSSYCMKYESRICSDMLLGTTQSETRFVPVPCTGEHATNCTHWNPTGILSYDAKTMQCFQHQKRTCTNSFDRGRYNESQYLNMTCPQAYTTCSNAMTKRAPCFTLTTKHCQVNPFGMRFTETLYTEKNCSGSSGITTSKPTITINTATNGHNVSHTTHLTSSNDSKQVPSSTMATSSRSRGMRTSRVPVVVIAGKFVSKDEYQKLSAESASKGSIIAGLAFGVLISFLGGIVVGIILMKWHGKKHEKVVVQHFNPGPITAGNPYVSQASQNMAFSYESFERFSNLESLSKVDNINLTRRSVTEDRNMNRVDGGRRRSLSWTCVKDYGDQESVMNRSQVKLM